MHPEAMIATFKSLKLFGMTQAIDDLAEQGSPAWHSAESVLDALLKAEVAEREVRSINYQMQAARFLIHRDLNGFDFADSAVNEAFESPICRSMTGRCACVVHFAFRAV
jgi:DNA replication protein DnaC